MSKKTTKDDRERGYRVIERPVQERNLGKEHIYPLNPDKPHRRDEDSVWEDKE